MNYYQTVVGEYLCADRALFVNTEFCLQMNPADNPDNSGPHWYCDALISDFRSKCVFLGEISFSAQLSDLAKRLKDGIQHSVIGLIAAGPSRAGHKPLIP